MDFNYNTININGESLKVGVYCAAFYCEPAYMEYHQKVFQHFGVNVNYIHDSQYHGEILDRICHTENVDYFCFVDVDAIPLIPNVLEILINRIHGKKAIIGIEQCSNNHVNEGDKLIALANAIKNGQKISTHINPSNNTHNVLEGFEYTYAGPAFFVISKEVYTFLGKPSFLETYRSDCGEEISYIAREKGVEVKYINFSHCIKPMWHLRDDIEFGIGSTYENLVYHNFQARVPSNLPLFIEQCSKILNDHE